MNKLALATAAAAMLGTAVAASAHRGMTLQGPQLTGVVLQSLGSDQALTGVTLASGEVINLQRRVAR